MHEQKIFDRFINQQSASLSRLSNQLYQQQQRVWEMLHNGVKALDAVQFRDVDCGDFSVRLQYNPQRIVSSGAKVDAASIKARKCFLCQENLPPEQLGILYQEKFLILCNPMPIFREHFTISHINHIPQSIEENVLPLLNLAKDFSSSHTIFYNGPKCGASAPDHMHFQASPSGIIPVERDAHEKNRRIHRKKIGGVDFYSLEGYGREVIMLESSIKQDMEFSFLRLVGAMRKIENTTEEPLLNVLCNYSENSWRMIVFPRSKHRPDMYFQEGDKQVLISPAAVDIGGLIVTPKEKDFQSVDSIIIKKIFTEVSVSHEVTRQIISAL